MEGKDMRKPLYGARACRAIGRNVGSVTEMVQRGIVTPDEARDLCGRLRREFEALVADGRMNPHQASKVEADLAAAAAAADKAAGEQ